MFLLPILNPHHYRHGRLPETILPMCSFQDESQWFFYLVMDLLDQVSAFPTTAIKNSSEPKPVVSPMSRRHPIQWSWGTKGCHSHGRKMNPTGIHLPAQVLVCGQDGNPPPPGFLFGSSGTLIHVCNSVLATLLILWFLWNHQNETTTTTSTATTATAALDTSATTTTTSISSREWSMWYIYLSQLGLVYDNGVRAMGRYLGEGQLLRSLSKHRFTLHVTVIPLLGITVTEIAGRYSLVDGTMHRWICSLLSGWSFLDLTKWQFFRHSQHLQVVDNRAGHANQGPFLSGTLSYTSGSIWEMCIPPILLVLYELLVGVVILRKAEFPLPCLPLDKESWLLTDQAWEALGQYHDSCSTPPWSAIYLILSAVLTLSTSCKSLRYPELQLFGENIHGILLWAAYTAS